MKFSLSWLKEHLDTTADLDTISRKLTSLGLEVEGISDRTKELAPFTVAYVVSAEKHPNADKLRVCMVDTGKGIVQVVCGAPNARTGMKGVFAPAGSHIPGTGVDLKPGVIRGVDSNGMLCSVREMGIGSDHDGIIELPDDAPLGASFAAYQKLDDPVLEIKLTPDRADCLGVRGTRSRSCRSRQAEAAEDSQDRRFFREQDPMAHHR
jgi:phenylalanyl-tRNA synthetase beta chain